VSSNPTPSPTSTPAPEPATSPAPASPPTPAQTRGRPFPPRRFRPLATAIAVFGVLAILPYSQVRIPLLFDGSLQSPGVLQLLAVCLMFAGLAISYDLLFGRTGIMSFGHGMFVTGGMYLTTILVNHAGYGLWTSALLGLAAGTLTALLLGAVALRSGGIAFAMVTLAFGQAVSILIVSGSPNLTGGEQGQTLNAAAVPGALSGIANTANLYWIALAYLIVCAAVVWGLSNSLPGRILSAVKENEQRVEVLGLNPYLFKLLAFVVAGFLATGGGVVYLLLLGGATPTVSTSDFTLALLVMVVLGGAGRRWGAILGGALYAYASQSLTRLSGSAAIAGLPGIVRGPLAQPLFLLGGAFVVIVFFIPGGFATLPGRITRLARHGKAADRHG
jgi:branched-chain amino acid transport system permease protein